MYAFQDLINHDTNYTKNIFDLPWKNDFSYARNFSFSKATMDYIIWLDADDFITDENIKKILELKSSNENSDFFMLKYSMGFDENNKPIGVIHIHDLLRAGVA